MKALQQHLIANIDGSKLSPNQKAEWNQVTKALDFGIDLETAMNHAQEEGLVKLICDLTGNFVTDLCHEYSTRLLTKQVSWPALRLFEKLVGGLPETDRLLHVATTNYDLLAEYAFDLIGLPYTTGFAGGICRKLNWEKCTHSMTAYECIPKGKRVTSQLRMQKHIRLYKVHGSLNTFLINDEVIENDYWTAACPTEATRAIITPGMSKYEKLHDFRSSFLHAYDEALENHDAFLFMGFGFNDNQLTNQALMNKLKRQGCPALVITRSITPNIKALADECENLWVVCKQQNNENARVFNMIYKDWLLLDQPLWDISVFTQTILGG